MRRVVAPRRELALSSVSTPGSPNGGFFPLTSRRNPVWGPDLEAYNMVCSGSARFTDDGLHVPGSGYAAAGTAYTITAPLGIGMLVRPAGFPTTQVLFGTSLTTGFFTGISLEVLSSGLPWFLVSTGAGYTGGQGTTALVANHWNHLFVRYDSSNVYFYVDGVAAGSFACTRTVGSSGKAPTVGAYWDGTYPFNGVIRDVAVWDGTCPTVAQVAQIAADSLATV